MQQTDRVRSTRRDRWLSPDRAGVIRRSALAFAVATAITAGICTPVAIRAAGSGGGSADAELVNLPPTSVVSTALREPDGEP
jgi:hypothetical protein